jgi:hypothetical protein
VSEQDRAKEQGEGVARNLEQSPREPAAPGTEGTQVNVNVEQQPPDPNQQPAPSEPAEKE